MALRRFLFLARWRWYELLGLILPMLLLAVAVWRLGSSTRKGSVCLACLLMGGSSILIAALFVPSSGPFLLVPFQVLRSFHLIYILGVLLLGGFLGTFASRSALIPAGVHVIVFVLMFAVGRVAWPDCRAVEIPGSAPVNPWEQAFLWVRGHTPANAVFAFNPHLLLLPGEDEQGFRAISERDQLAGDKDAGVAVLLPRLAQRALRQRDAELRIDTMTDAQRLAVLRPLGANWVLLSRGAVTRLPCPYRNRVIQVCRLGD